MKKLITFFISLLIGVFSVSCNIDSDENRQTDSLTESGENTISEEKNDIDYDKSLEPVYEFLSSKYVIISTRKTFDTVYVTYYYFVDGTVAGIKSVIAFPDTDSATDYYDSVKDEYKHARLDGMTVTNYLEEDEDFFYGYSLDKLLFVLDKTDYEIIIGFDKNEFYKDFSGVEYD